jgi:hypothetical protein
MARNTEQLFDARSVPRREKFPAGSPYGRQKVSFAIPPCKGGVANAPRVSNGILTVSVIDEFGQIHDGEENVTNKAKMYTGKLLICDLPEASTFNVLVASTDEGALWFHPTRTA